jgi:hypothetical protein
MLQDDSAVSYGSMGRKHEKQAQSLQGYWQPWYLVAVALPLETWYQLVVASGLVVDLVVMSWRW